MVFHYSTYKPVAIVSHYDNNGSRNSDGRAYGGHRIAASRSLPFGTRIKFTYKNHHWIGVVSDRLAPRYDKRFDLPTKSFQQFIGRKGIAKCSWKIISKPKKKQRKYHRHENKTRT